MPETPIKQIIVGNIQIIPQKKPLYNTEALVFIPVNPARLILAIFFILIGKNKHEFPQKRL
jgi:hypothetical protein